MEQSPPRRLVRSRTDRIFAGVCGGLAQYFQMDPTLVRLLFAVLVFGGGMSIGLYIILWIVMPEEGAVDTGLDSRLHAFGSEVRANTERLTHDIQSAGGQGTSRRTWFALIIILLGVWLLGKQIFPWSWLHEALLWPVVVILVGFYLIFKH